MPEVAANAVEAVLQGWPVAERSPFATGDVIATIETEKAVVDVEADAEGVLLRALVPEGATVPVGAPIALLADPGESVPDIDAVLASLDVTGSPATPGGAPGPAGVPGGAAGGATRSGDRALGRVFSSPLARRLAKEARLPLEEISGTGPNGRIIRRDVEAAIQRHTSAPTAPRPPAPHPAESGPHQVRAAHVPARAQGRAPAGDPSPPAAASGTTLSAQGRVEAHTDIPHTRARRAIAARLTGSKRDTPHFYLRGTAHAGRLLKLRRELNDGGATVKISVNDLVVKAAARAHVLVPAMNVIWTPEATRRFESVDVAVAIATERGLVTPVLRSAERATLTSLAAAVKDFAERARAGRLRQEELEGGTLTVTNLGMYGTEEFAAIINPPQSAILAVGAVREEPVVRKGKVRAGAVMRVTLSVDHRPIDGTVAAEWMRAFLDLLEHPVRILV
ncbi:2-oxo acid dehydrogenase subunit E2 [Nonomuraea sp. NPDC048916]|uniref:2-oxo acid dehydrogenase subunit E2 n=1 Tax=Nonomuraea sp. NPDC048916 TaxID=3154232 RepID=UPI0033D3DD77